VDRSSRIGARPAYFEMARRTGARWGARRDRSSVFPKIVVEET